MHFGFVADDRFLSLVYSAADLFVIPSARGKGRDPAIRLVGAREAPAIRPPARGKAPRPVSVRGVMNLKCPLASCRRRVWPVRGHYEPLASTRCRGPRRVYTWAS